MANPTKEQQKAWRDANKERIHQYMKEWRAKNKAHRAEYAKQYWEGNERYAANQRASAKRRYHEAYKHDPEYKTKAAARNKQWVADNPDKVKAKCAKYRSTHREELAQKAKEVYWANPESARQKNRERADYYAQWCEANKAQVKAWQREYRAQHQEENRERCLDRYLRNRHEYIVRAEDRQRNLRDRGSYTQDDVDRLYVAQRGICPGCGLHMANSRDRKVQGHYEVDHVMPVALGGSNTPDNLQLLCCPCNRRKHAKHPDVWAKEVEQVRTA